MYLSWQSLGFHLRSSAARGRAKAGGARQTARGRRSRRRPSFPAQVLREVVHELPPVAPPPAPHSRAPACPHGTRSRRPHRPRRRVSINEAAGARLIDRGSCRAQHAGDGVGVAEPHRRLGAQVGAARRRDGVVPRSPVVLAQAPLGGNPPAILQSPERRIERAFLDVQHVAGSRLDPARDAVAVPGRRGEP